MPKSCCNLQPCNSLDALCVYTLSSRGRRYCNTCAYLIAPQLVPPAAVARAGGFMALVFQVASLAALAVAFAVQAWRVPSPGGIAAAAEVLRGTSQF